MQWQPFRAVHARAPSVGAQAPALPGGTPLSREENRSLAQLEVVHSLKAGASRFPRNFGTGFFAWGPEAVLRCRDVKP